MGTSGNTPALQNGPVSGVESGGIVTNSKVFANMQGCPAFWTHDSSSSIFPGSRSMSPTSSLKEIGGLPLLPCQTLKTKPTICPKPNAGSKVCQRLNSLPVSKIRYSMLEDGFFSMRSCRHQQVRECCKYHTNSSPGRHQMHTDVVSLSEL